MIHKTNKYIYKEIHLILLHTPLDNCKSVIRNIMLIKKNTYIYYHIYIVEKINIPYCLLKIDVFVLFSYANISFDLIR